MKISKSYSDIFKFILFSIGLVCLACQDINHLGAGYNPKAQVIKTEQITGTDYNRIIYVSGNDSVNSADGSKEKPYHSIEQAVSQIESASTENKAAVFVAKGLYSGETILLKKYVDIYGGFESKGWIRDIEKYQTTLSGDEQRRILIAVDSAVVDGFYFTDGVIRGKGAAVYCDGTSPIISNNIFFGNKTLGPENWNPKYWHETAHDGGAIHGQNGASPLIRNNIFVNNKTENGRGAAVSFDGQCKPVIKENVFFSNIAGLKDPMRSSDGGAINIFNWSDALIDGNMFISNRAESKNDGGAVFIALWSSARVTNNIFVDNHSGDDAGALFVGGQEHRYDAPLDPIPVKDKFFVSITNNTFIGNHHGGTNSGAMRFTMESRGEFIGNVLAHNNGVYFQRSEVHIADNIILDNFLFIETKAGLDMGIIENNLLWAAYDQQVEADVKNNNMLYPLEGNGNYHKTPHFVNDGIEITSLSTNYKRKDYSTLVNLNNFNFVNNQLVGRVVKAGRKWGVIKSNTASTITLWGDFAGLVNFTILPTYTLINK